MQALACSTQQCRCQLPPVEAAPSSPLPCIICEVDKILPFHSFLQMQHIIRNMDAVRPLQLISAPRERRAGTGSGAAARCRRYDTRGRRMRSGGLTACSQSPSEHAVTFETTQRAGYLPKLNK